jgi:hypothetical protein
VQPPTHTLGISTTSPAYAKNRAIYGQCADIGQTDNLAVTLPLVWMKNLGVTLGWCLGHSGPQDRLVDHTHKPIFPHPCSLLSLSSVAGHWRHRAVLQDTLLTRDAIFAISAYAAVIQLKRPRSELWDE